MTHGFAWRDVGFALPWRDACVLARAFARRDECETHRALNPDWWVTPDVVLLRDTEHATRVGAWIRSEDARKKRNYPERVLLTAAERKAAAPARENYDLMTLAEVDKMMGWDRSGD